MFLIYFIGIARNDVMYFNIINPRFSYKFEGIFRFLKKCWISKLHTAEAFCVEVDTAVSAAETSCYLIHKWQHEQLWDQHQTKFWLCVLIISLDLGQIQRIVQPLLHVNQFDCVNKRETGIHDRVN